MVNESRERFSRTRREAEEGDGGVNAGVGFRGTCSDSGAGWHDLLNHSPTEIALQLYGIELRVHVAHCVCTYFSELL